MEQRRQSRFPFDINIWRPAREPLHLAQQGGCAFCEKRTIELREVDLEHFRPKLAARDDEQAGAKTWPDHYWWLAYEWENMLVICKTCNANKRNWFPLAGKRAEAGAKGSVLDKEQPLLVDPYREDPSEYLHFHVDGTVSGVGPKGETTVAICGLNRPALVTARKEAMEDQRRSGERDVPDHVEFAAARRAAFQPIVGAAQIVALSAKVSGRATVRTQAFRYVELVEIQNFRAIDQAKIQIPFGREETGGWKVLLGENSAGKSTVLKAIAMALMGQNHLTRLQLDPKRILNRRKVGKVVKTAKSGFIKVTMSDGPPIEIRFSKGEIAFTAGGEGVRGPVRGYGSMRLLPEDGNTAIGEGAGCDVSNLFNPRATLVDAERRMVQLFQEDLPRFDRFAKNLNALLGLDEGQESTTVDQKGKLRIRLNGVPIGVDELSDGYQSMLALGVDLMNAFARDAEMESDAGILLLDELGAHLHPRWRMEIVKRLRTTFRRLQVIATTHEPLCLHGLNEKEAVLLRRGPNGKLELLEEEEGRSVKGMRVDQILMSPLFGLESTIDPTIEKDFQAYYYLLGKATLTATEKQRLDELRDALRPHRALGYTRRDQVLYEMIDSYLAQEKLKPATQRIRLRETTMKKLERAWKDLDFKGLGR